MEDYLFSAVRREKRGLLTNQLRLYQAQQAVREGKSFNIHWLRCMLCGVQCDTSVMHLHEIVARGLIGNKQSLEQLPVELHALLCPDCNIGRADHQLAREQLISYSINMWGKRIVREAISKFNEVLKGYGGQPLSPLVIDYKLLDD